MRRIFLGLTLAGGLSGAPSAWAQSDYDRGAAAGNLACKTRPPLPYPDGASSEEYIDGWLSGCHRGIGEMHGMGWHNGSYSCRRENYDLTSVDLDRWPTLRREFNEGFVAGCLAVRPKAPPPVPPAAPPPAPAGGRINCNDPEIPLIWRLENGCPRPAPDPETGPAPAPAPAPAPPPPAPGSRRGGIDCNDPEIPRIWKSQNGCPGFGPEAPGAPPAPPPGQAPPPPARAGRIVNGINCDDPEIPSLWKHQAGCSGTVPNPPTPPPAAEPPAPPPGNPPERPPLPPPPSPEPDPDPPAGPPGPPRGVTLTLEFPPGESPAGFTAYVIVPVEAARSYAGWGLPAGAVSGNAWSGGERRVVLSTNRDTGLASGRRHVVFLTWAREVRPVAILDLPRGGGDYTGTLPATLDSASLLARLGGP